MEIMLRYFSGAFYPYLLKREYELSGTWPDDGVDVDDSVYDAFKVVPDGKMIGTDTDGMPCWIDIPLSRPTFAQALATLNAVYVKARDELCAAWLRAAVADGVEESSRKEDVEMELAELDAKHATDVAAIKSEHGVAQ